MFHKCLSCQISASDKGMVQGYHKKCSKKLFGTSRPPTAPFKSTEVVNEAQKMIGRMSISGVQPKLSAIYNRKSSALTIVDRGGIFILKPPSDPFESLPENENLCMNIASTYGIEAPPHGLLFLMDGKLSYVVKRFDRREDGSKLQQEDFQQLLQAEDKYQGSYEMMANFLKKHSNIPGLDLVNLFERALLFFIIGNGDAHLKNFSLLNKEEVGYSLSPVYDIVNSRLVLPEEKDEMCLSLQGKRNNISRKDFRGLSAHFGLSMKQLNNALERMIGIRTSIESMIEESFLKEDLKSRFLGIFQEKMRRIYN